jgi:septal ring factor EnvC (AmiA/AmiB activator)
LSVTGAITATGDITANTSDKRLKENVKQIENALDKVSKINGITYNFTDDALILNPALNKSEQVGFLAQEVQSVLPHIIKPAPFDVDVKTGQSISGENYLTIQYEKIVPLLLEAIKELKAEVEELKKK